MKFISRTERERTAKNNEMSDDVQKGAAKKTAQLLRELNDELDEEKQKRLKLEKLVLSLLVVRYS